MMLIHRDAQSSRDLTTSGCSRRRTGWAPSIGPRTGSRPGDGQEGRSPEAWPLPEAPGRFAETGQPQVMCRGLAFSAAPFQGVPFDRVDPAGLHQPARPSHPLTDDPAIMGGRRSGTSPSQAQAPIGHSLVDPLEIGILRLLDARFPIGRLDFSATRATSVGVKPGTQSAFRAPAIPDLDFPTPSTAMGDARGSHLELRSGSPEGRLDWTRTNLPGAVVAAPGQPLVGQM